MNIKGQIFLISILGILFFATPALSATYVDSAHGSTFTCNFACHALHGSGGSTLLGASDPETLCMSCHGPGGSSTLKAAVHSPAGISPDTVTCLECHNPHANRDYSTDGGLSAAGTNIKLVGVQFDPFDGTEYPYATIRERKTTAPLGDVGTARFVAFAASPDDWTRPDGLGLCQSCHTAPHNEGQDCTGCHDHDAGFAGSGACDSCHDINSGHVTAPLMFDKTGGNFAGVPYGNHLIASGTDDLSTVTDWAVQCGKCHGAHNGDVMVPNNPDVGIEYNSHGGIWLGGTETGGATTEAEICWGCHDTEGVSEWGVNTDTNGATAPNYNFGTLSNNAGVNGAGWYSDTTTSAGATWTSAQADFSYKTAAIQSTHAASTAGRAGVDLVENIRCSYCHNVHTGTNGDGSTAGAPYLRGTWKGNPYKEDGAPQSGMTFGQHHWGPVPRGSTNNAEYGGYHIDQNTANTPGSMSWTADNSSGLCSLCHGSNTDGTWALPGDINTMDMSGVVTATDGSSPAFSTNNWVGSNGHANAVLGGDGTGAADIFNTADRAPSGVNTDGANPDMAYANFGSNVGYGFRGTHSRSFTHTPGLDGSLRPGKEDEPRAGQFYSWGATVDASSTTPQIGYHQFSCSKCHNPHASRLPRLMITNCLDTSHNTWDQNAGDGGPSRNTSNNNGITLNATTSPDNWGRTWSNTTSAQNCHRVAGQDDGSTPGYGTGWNTVTPW